MLHALIAGPRRLRDRGARRQDKRHGEIFRREASRLFLAVVLQGERVRRIAGRRGGDGRGEKRSQAQPIHVLLYLLDDDLGQTVPAEVAHDAARRELRMLVDLPLEVVRVGDSRHATENPSGIGKLRLVALGAAVEIDGVSHPQR